MGGHTHKLNAQRWILPMVGVSSALVYAAVMLRLPLPANVLEVKRTLEQMPSSEWWLGGVISLCILLLLGGYGLGTAALRRGWRATWPTLLGFPALFCTLLFFTFPITSADIYDYLFRGWMLVHYGINPLVVPPAALPNEPLLPYVAWPNAVSAYGPLWERLGAVMVWFAAVRPGAAPPDFVLFRLVLGYKALGLIGYALCGWAIWATLSGAATHWRRLGLYLWLWNPLVLWESIGAAHNDVWMALAVVLAIWAIRIWRERRPDVAQHAAPVFVLVALAAGGLIKFLAFFFGPLALAALLRETAGWRNRMRLVFLGGAACFALAAVAYWPLWAGSGTFQNVGDRRELYTASWLAALHPLLAGWLGRATASNVTAWLGLALLTGGMLVTTWRLWRAPRSLEREILRLVLWFLLLCNPWFQPWYLVWAAALAAILPWSRRMVWVIGVFCVTASLSYVADGFALPALGLDQPPFVRELLMALFLYVPPFGALLWPHAGNAEALTPADGSAIMPGKRPRSSVDRATVS